MISSESRMRENRTSGLMSGGLETGPREPDCGPERKRRTSHRTLKLARQPSTPHQSLGADHAFISLIEAIVNDCSARIGTVWETVMRICWKAIVAGGLGVVFALGATHTASAERCNMLSSSSQTSAVALYNHAKLLGQVFGVAAEQNGCVAADSSSSSISPLVDPEYSRDLTLSGDAWNNMITELWDRYSSLPAPETDVYLDENGTVYVTCRQDSNPPRLALSWEESEHSNDGAPETLYVSLRTAIIMSDNFLSTLSDYERIGLQTFVLETTSNGAKNRVTAIPGTDFSNIADLRSSLTSLVRESCVFPIADMVIDTIKYSADNRRFQAGLGPLENITVMGHSLGGTAAHYVAERRASRSTNVQANTDAQFQAYSFNALGLDPRYRTPNVSQITSYYVYGELVSLLGSVFDWWQEGRAFRGVPPGGTRADPEDLPDSWWKLPLWDWGERIDRHKLVSVQETLCQCTQNHSGFLDLGAQPNEVVANPIQNR